MKPASFEYLRPSSLGEALALLARGGEGCKLVAGGQSLAPMMNMRSPRTLPKWRMALLFAAIFPSR